MRRIAGGDSEALMTVYQLYGRTVYSLACYIVQDEHGAEEIAQDVFLAVWQKAHQFDSGRGNLRAWLLQIARNLSIDRLRQRRRRAPEVHPLELAEILPSPPASGHGDETRELYDHLLRLPREQREAIELSYFQGYTHQEIAARLNLPLGTVKSRILLGLRKLHFLMK
jgi:RNA polymerase sigma-70 factor (ECF subfamily)